jgi:Flp pilus assembly protein TadG
MMRRVRALIACQRGSSAIEFAIVAWPLLFLVLGTFEFGRLLWTREALQETAMAGARCMGILQSSCTTSGAYSSSQTTSFIKQVASQWSVNLSSSGTISLNTNATCGGVGGFSQVSISYPFQTVVPAVMKALAGGVTLSTSACFPNQS